MDFEDLANLVITSPGIFFYAVWSVIVCIAYKICIITKKKNIT